MVWHGHDLFLDALLELGAVGLVALTWESVSRPRPTMAPLASVTVTAAPSSMSLYPPCPAQPPANAWPLLAERLGTSVVVKHENHTPIGAFKVRGGLVYLDRLKREQPKVPGII